MLCVLADANSFSINDLARYLFDTILWCQRGSRRDLPLSQRIYVHATKGDRDASALVRPQGRVQGASKVLTLLDPQFRNADICLGGSIGDVERLLCHRIAAMNARGR